MDRHLANGQPIFEFKSITKEFPGVLALDDVSLQLFPGEVLALVGENGAGKSTLLRLMSGDYQPDKGNMEFEEKPIIFASPADSHAAGVRVIYQEPEILIDLTVAENIYIGELPRRAGPVIDWNLLNVNTRDILEKLGVGAVVSPHVKAGKLSAAQRQIIEIARAIKSKVKVLALDEPTSSLSEEDSAHLFNIVEQFRKAGVGIIYVSHRLAEVIKLADRIAVLRDGKLIAVKNSHETNEAELVNLMVGRDLVRRFDHQSHAQAEVILKAEGLNTEKVHNISFEVRRGEVVGFAGLVGAGRTDVAKALFGEDKLVSGKIFLEGQEIKVREPMEAIRAGIGFSPEDRKREALILLRSVKDNITLVILKWISRLSFIKSREEHRIVNDLVSRLRVKTPSLEQEVGKLSGGNQQKVVLARWLARQPKVLILDEPTRGIDVGAKSEIYKLIGEMASQGMGVIFISSELPEVLGVSDRIVVMKNGYITGEVSASQASEEVVLHLAMAKHLN
jgi:L-arabinose transport system ATP-binding protein